MYEQKTFLNAFLNIIAQLHRIYKIMMLDDAVQRLGLDRDI